MSSSFDAERTQFCTHCGEFIGTNTFCTNCGQRADLVESSDPHVRIEDTVVRDAPAWSPFAPLPPAAPALVAPGAPAGPPAPVAAPRVTPGPPRRSSGLAWVIGGAIAILLLAGIGVGALYLVARSGGSSSTDSSRPPVGGSGSPGATTPTDTPTPDSGAGCLSGADGTGCVSAVPLAVPAAGKVCDVQAPGDGPFDAAGVADTTTTSCAFADAVRAAYIARGQFGEPITLTARSPVTKRTYVMQCVGTQPVTCTGGTNAEVLLGAAPDSAAR